MIFLLLGASIARAELHFTISKVDDARIRLTVSGTNADLGGANESILRWRSDEVGLLPDGFTINDGAVGTITWSINGGAPAAPGEVEMNGNYLAPGPPTPAFDYLGLREVDNALSAVDTITISGSTVLPGDFSQFTEGSKIYESLLGPVRLTVVEVAPSLPVTLVGDVSPAADDVFWTDPVNDAQEVVVGQNASGSLVLEDGYAVHSKLLHVSDTVDGPGEVTLRGTGTSWTTSENVDIGHDAFGVLRVEDGAVMNAGTTLSVDIDDAGGGGMLVLDNGMVNTLLLSADALELSGSGTIHTSGLDGQGYGFNTLDFNGSDTFSFLLTNDRADAITMNVFANENFIIRSDVWFRNGADVSIQDGYIGAEAGVPGTATISGAGTKVAITKDLRVGHKSAGTLVIEDGAELDVSGTVFTHGVGSLSGDGSILLDNGILNAGILRAHAIDFSGSGTVRCDGIIGAGYDFLFDGASTGVMTVDNGRGDNVQMELDGTNISLAEVPMRLVNGADVTINSLNLGKAAGDSDRVELDGVGTKMTVTSPLVVGKSGEMRLSISNGALLVAPEISLGERAGGLGLLELDGSGSQLTVGGRIDVGGAGEGIVRLSAGAKIISGIAVLGAEPGSNGVVELSGAGTEWACDSMILGSAAPGSLILREGAGVMAEENVVIGELGEFTIFLSGDEVINASTNGQTGPGLFFDGQVQMIADRGVAAGTYAPLQANGSPTIYAGTDTPHIFGMTRDDFTSEMLVPDIVAEPGALTGVDLSGQRLSYDSGKLEVLMHGWAGTGDLEVSALGLSHAAGRKVVCGYGLSSTVGRNAVLRVFVGTDFDAEELSVVRRADSGSAWEGFTPALVDFKDGYLTFRIDAYAEYAVTTPFDLASFRSTFGLAGDGSDDAADWSLNGVPNLLYFVYGLGDPAEVNIDRSRLPAIAADGDSGGLTFSFVRPSDHDGEFEFAVLTSTDLGGWLRVEDAGIDYLPIGETITPIDVGHERVEQTYRLLEGEIRRFYRLKVTVFSAL